MNPLDVLSAKTLFSKIKSKVSNFKNVKVIICPPFVYIGDFAYDKKIQLGAQNLFWENKGAYTGEISPFQLTDLGVDYVILGHSERRALGESNEVVNKKVKTALASGLYVILCIGESDRDDRGEYLHFIKEEISESLRNVSKKSLAKVLIAYEPIWSIGTSKAITPRDLHQMKLYILKILKDIYGESAMSVNILYGGSTSPENTESLIRDGEVAGLLVGSQSLDAKSFLEIIKIANSLK